MKKPIVDTSAFEDLRSQKLCTTKIEYICVWAVWMAVLISVGVQLWSEYSTPAGLALGRIVILGVMALGYNHRSKRNAFIVVPCQPTGI